MRVGIVILMLSLSACAAQKHPATHSFFQGPLSGSARHEVFAIDMTLSQLKYENEKASSAISENDAEIVYLDRFKDGLLKRREAICREAKNKSKR